MAHQLPLIMGLERCRVYFLAPDCNESRSSGALSMKFKGLYAPLCPTSDSPLFNNCCVFFEGRKIQTFKSVCYWFYPVRYSQARPEKELKLEGETKCREQLI